MPGSDGHPVDLAVIGGGIAGLWILDAAVRAGRNAILVEAFELGHGQSVAAQGIIHGGQALIVPAPLDDIPVFVRV